MQRLCAGACSPFWALSQTAMKPVVRPLACAQHSANKLLCVTQGRHVCRGNDLLALGSSLLLTALSSIAQEQPVFSRNITSFVMKGNMLSVAKDTVSSGQKASACALLEAAIRQYEEAIGLKSSAVKTAFRRAEQLLASLPDNERQKVCLLCTHDAKPNAKSDSREQRLCYRAFQCMPAGSVQQCWAAFPECLPPECMPMHC